MFKRNSFMTLSALAAISAPLDGQRATTLAGRSIVQLLG